jgi:predicted Zn finger-like uncharacterized protein
MKIACESCGAKYSIADEKVAGKVFKIRCKRCSEVIVVKGDQQGASDAAQAGPGVGEPIWHIVINGDQAGPYAPDQLAEMLTNGTVDWDAYVWAEGFDNWVPMRDVPDLVAQISGGGQQAQVEQRASYEAQPDAFAAQPSMGADPFADEPAPASAGFAAAAPAEPDLFGGGGRVQASSPFDTGGSHVHASSPSPRGMTGGVSAGAADSAMTGARNENSVLFSLKNLQSLATGSAPATNVPSASGQAHAGYAGGEGSGLIDIRALASATGLSDAEAKAGAKDELLAIGNQGAFGALGSPMLAPAHDDEGSGKKMLIWAVVAGVGLLSIAAVAVAYIMRPTETGPQQQIGLQQQLPPAPAPSAAPAADPGAPEEAKTEGELAAAAAAKEASEAAEERGSDGKPRRKPSSSSGTTSSGSSSSGASTEASKPAPAEPKAPSKPSGPRSIDDLLDGALGGGAKPKSAAAEAPKANLPDLPSRDDVMNAMGSVKGAVSACAQGQTGVAFANVSVAGATGRVTSAAVTGIPGPAGSCVAKAVRGAQYPTFQQKVFKLKFPYKL